MESSNLWGNSCIYGSTSTLCGSYSNNNMFAFSNNNGYVGVGYYYDDLDCWSNQHGMFSCDQYFDY